MKINTKTSRNMLVALVLGATLVGCSSFLGGGAAGAAGTSAGYEFSANRQIKQLDNDLKAGLIDKKEHEIRRNQIERGSLLY